MWLTQYNYFTETSDLIRQYIVPYKHDIAKKCCKMINNVEECRKFRFNDELKREAVMNCMHYAKQNMNRRIEDGFIIELSNYILIEF